MYIVECSYIYSDFANPWKVTLIEPQLGSYVETLRLKDEEAVYAAIESYKEQYGNDKVLVSERVYSVGPKLNYKRFYNESDD